MLLRHRLVDHPRRALGDGRFSIENSSQLATLFLSNSCLLALASSRVGGMFAIARRGEPGMWLPLSGKVIAPVRRPFVAEGLVAQADPRTHQPGARGHRQCCFRASRPSGTPCPPDGPTPA